MRSKNDEWKIKAKRMESWRFNCYGLITWSKARDESFDSSRGKLMSGGGGEGYNHSLISKIWLGILYFPSQLANRLDILHLDVTEASGCIVLFAANHSPIQLKRGALKNLSLTDTTCNVRLHNQWNFLKTLQRWLRIHWNTFAIPRGCWEFHESVVNFCSYFKLHSISHGTESLPSRSDRILLNELNLAWINYVKVSKNFANRKLTSMLYDFFMTKRSLAWWTSMKPGDMAMVEVDMLTWIFERVSANMSKKTVVVEG